MVRLREITEQKNSFFAFNRKLVQWFVFPVFFLDIWCINVL